MNPYETLPDLEVDQFNGKLRAKAVMPSQTMVYNPLNRNLLYTKHEVDARFNAIPSITVSNSAPANPRTGDLWVDTT